MLDTKVETLPPSRQLTGASAGLHVTVALTEGASPCAAARGKGAVCWSPCRDPRGEG